VRLESHASIAWKEFVMAGLTGASSPNLPGCMPTLQHHGSVQLEAAARAMVAVCTPHDVTTARRVVLAFNVGLEKHCQQQGMPCCCRDACHRLWAHQLATRTLVGVNAGPLENARAISDVALMPSSETPADTRTRMSPAGGLAGWPDTSEASP
jgi:hypothetical protein